MRIWITMWPQVHLNLIQLQQPAQGGRHKPTWACPLPGGSIQLPKLHVNLPSLFLKVSKVEVWPAAWRAPWTLTGRFLVWPGAVLVAASWTWGATTRVTISGWGNFPGAKRGKATSFDSPTAPLPHHLAHRGALCQNAMNKKTPGEH